MRTVVICSSLALVGCVVVFLTRPARSIAKPPRAELKVAADRVLEKNRLVETAWSPVEKAMATGDVQNVNAAFGAFEASGQPIDDNMRADIADFDMKHGAMIDAQKQLNLIVYRDRSTPVKVSDGRRTGLRWPPRSYQASWCLMWLGANPAARKTERNAVILAWSKGYRKEGLRKGAFADLSPEALLEFIAGSDMEGNRHTRQEAVAHLRRAFALEPKSIDIANQLIGALHFVGDREGAKKIALRAYALTGDRLQKEALLSSNGLTPKDLKRDIP